VSVGRSRFRVGAPLFEEKRYELGPETALYLYLFVAVEVLVGGRETTMIV
jgi:hypothetical protein